MTEKKRTFDPKGGGGRMNLNTLIKTVIKFAPMVFNLARNEKVQQVLKIGWHMYSNRNQPQARRRKKIRR
jgi:hypothetical protein